MKWFKKKKGDRSKDERSESKSEEAHPAAEPDTEQRAEPDREDTSPPTSEPDLDKDASQTLATTAEPQADKTENLPAGTSDKKKGLFSRLRRGLKKTREILTTDIEDLFSRRGAIDDELLEELEELLITSDIGVQTTMDLMERISGKSKQIEDAEGLKAVLREEILSLFGSTDVPKDEFSKTSKPHIIMVVGVNGVGKTTTIGKLAARYTRAGQSVLIVAADTFRAAAIEQLSIWAERAKADIVKQKDGADPAAVAFDGIQAACSRKVDIVLVDTAGRLHTKVNLMEELKKIKRSISKNVADAPHEIVLVLDATTGQNAISQARMFHEALDISSLALTKLDGTAKGGIVVSICNSLNIPLRFVGVGESIDDLQDFKPDRFVEALF